MEEKFLFKLWNAFQKIPFKNSPIFQSTAHDSRKVSIYCQNDLEIPEYCTISSVSSVVPERSDVKSCYSVTLLEVKRLFC